MLYYYTMIFRYDIYEKFVSSYLNVFTRLFTKDVESVLDTIDRHFILLLKKTFSLVSFVHEYTYVWILLREEVFLQNCLFWTSLPLFLFVIMARQGYPQMTLCRGFLDTLGLSLGSKVIHIGKLIIIKLFKEDDLIWCTYTHYIAWP